MASARAARFQEVDALRGLAALTVVFSHYFPYWQRYLGDTFIPVPSEFGYYAVKLFFVISGFVIFFTLDRCTTVRDFAVLRFSRLYPAYWVSLVLATAVSVLLVGNDFWAGGFVANMTMFQQFVGVPNYDNVYWSLTVELAFYLNVAWLFAFGLHRRAQWVVFVWLVLAAAWVLMSQDVGAVTVYPFDRPRDWLALLFALDFAPYFAMGIAFYAASREGWKRSTMALFAAAAVVEFLLASWDGLAIAAVAGTLFALAVNGRLRFLLIPPILWLGAISYSLYVVHRNIGYQALDWMKAMGMSAGLAIAIAVAGSLLIATAMAYGVERPASAAIRRWYGRYRGKGSRDQALPSLAAPPSTPLYSAASPEHEAHDGEDQTDDEQDPRDLRG